MRTVSIKDVVAKPMAGLPGQLACSINETGALYPVSVSRRQSSAAALAAAIMLSVSTIAHSATEHDPAAHDASKHEASKKVYPSRAAQGVEAPLAAGASIHKMTLTHHELEAWSFVPKRKDRIEIINRSDITHALYITYPDGTVVNLEVQIPGDVVSWTVPDDAEGEYLFRCWIHPVIRAKMMIEE